jgi:hypothetical protein
MAQEVHRKAQAEEEDLSSYLEEEDDRNYLEAGNLKEGEGILDYDFDFDLGWEVMDVIDEEEGEECIPAEAGRGYNSS